MFPSQAGWNWVLFSLYRQQFQDTDCFSKLPYLGMKLGLGKSYWHLHIYSLSTPGVEIELIFALWAAIFETWDDFQNFNIWAWNLEFEDGPQSCICTLSTPRSRNCACFYSTWGHFHDIANFSWLLDSVSRAILMAQVSVIRCPSNQVPQKPLHETPPSQILWKGTYPPYRSTFFVVFFSKFLTFKFLRILFVFINMGPYGNQNFKTLFLTYFFFFQFQPNFMIHMLVIG